MIHVLIIMLVAIVAGRDGVEGLPFVQGLAPGSVALWTLAPMAAIGLALQVRLFWCGRRLDRTGTWRWIHLADGALASSRYIAVLFQAVAVIGLGWLDVVRESVGGNIILVDEAIATLPPLLVFVLGWWSYFPIDRRLREATILRHLDTTGHVPRMPTRWEFTWEQTRHHLLIVLAPVTLILAWTDTVDAVAALMGDRLDSYDADTVHLAVTGLHLAGVALVLLIVPLLLKVIWTTVPLGPGELRDRLMALCRLQGVRCRDLLVWRTHSNMVNGAVVGLLPAVRYILLTDALLEQLPARQVEAVMAHEVAHARRHHLPWLMGMMITTITLTWTLTATAVEMALPDELRLAEPPSPLSINAGLIAALAVGVVIFGWVSRRFEEQADAFAAQHLSGAAFGGRVPDDVMIQPEAAATMAGALGAVCVLNHIPPTRFSWRHGSIAGRQRRLMRLIGRPARVLPIDRLVWGLKGATLVGLAALVGLWFWAG